ncbi:MAG: thioredoxin fold domain-containing protein [Chromatiales bacterium]|nr:thioredoxin fold domain-containing protein [Gammaproteobacteria bacterium]MCP5353046.1 thioredoxin fold domain-containing protein [Chromatiales bacterium]
MSLATHHEPAIHVDRDEFEDKVIAASHQRPVLVDFWADWCAPCLTLGPVLAHLAEEQRERFQLVKVEVDEGENMKLAGHYKLRGFPTCILFVNGDEVARFAGHRPMPWLREFLDTNVPS